MKISEVLARPANWQAWGASHSNSQVISGEAARAMGVPDYQMEELPNRMGANIAAEFLKAIADSQGSSEPLYHGFKNNKNLKWQIGQIVTLPLTASSGDVDGAAGYGITNNPKKIPVVIFAFPIGTKFAGYGKWGKTDAADFGYTWNEAIVAGKFRVNDIKSKNYEVPPNAPKYTIVYMQPLQFFDPMQGVWKLYQN